ncbi:MAG: DUF1326 domain-containing protein [Planctomycetota bacterium]|nr:DUF1326 domain-containing protein [Planctomycetota bacterium]
MNLISLVLAAFVTIGAQAKAPAPITGDYVEVRTASVFAGACHYNGELVTTGRDALLAMNIASGTWNGTNLAGVRVMADVSSPDNLGNEKAARKSEVVIDSAATDRQVAAITSILRTRYQAALGDIVSIRRAPITFTHQADEYKVSAEGFASYDVQSMPNNDCCKQPSLVWYTPIVPLTNRKVGYTITASYSAGTNSELFQRGDENSAFYGQFSL